MIKIKDKYLYKFKTFLFFSKILKEARIHSKTYHKITSCYIFLLVLASMVINKLILNEVISIKM